jgi:hypothetical protein
MTLSEEASLLGIALRRENRGPSQDRFYQVKQICSGQPGERENRGHTWEASLVRGKTVDLPEKSGVK